MVRIADILKKKAEGQQAKPPASEPPPEQKTQSEQPSPSVKEEPQSQERPELHKEPGIRISETVLAKSKLLSQKESIELYSETVSLVKEIYDWVKAGKEITEENLKDIIVYVGKFVDQQCLDNDNILSLINLPTENDFIYKHVVNVGIICIDLGCGLGYDKAKLIELGSIAIVHDMGMTKFHDLYNRPHQFNEKEFAEIKNHCKIGAEILGKFKDKYKRMVSVVYQEHERLDGSGYPLGLKEEAIDEYAKIIGLADMYEALTHLRPYRSETSPAKVLDILLLNRNGFWRKIMKVLIERLASPFPVGSNIKLSSGEKGKVIKRNLACPLRPVVEIVSEADEEKLAETRTIDLAKHPTIYIKGILEEKI
jgi:HD-GYP domain-containing protein (c-di-GMP phosphodiesterase class II)